MQTCLRGFCTDKSVDCVTVATGSTEVNPAAVRVEPLYCQRALLIFICAPGHLDVQPFLWVGVLVVDVAQEEQSTGLLLVPEDLVVVLNIV